MVATPQFMKVRVTRENLDPLKWGRDVQLLSNYAMRKMADNLRDRMREAYRKSIHGTEYSIYSNGSYSLENFIVTSQVAPGVFSVGAKKQALGHQTVDEIFMYMDQGTGIYNGGREYWRFQFEGTRSGSSDNNWWATKGQEGKEFISGPASSQLNTFQRDSDVIIGPPLQAYWLSGGKVIKI